MLDYRVRAAGLASFPALQWGHESPMVGHAVCVQVDTPLVWSVVLQMTLTGAALARLAVRILG